MIYEKGEQLYLPDGTKDRFYGETDEHYLVERDFQYLVKYDKREIDLLNVGVPFLSAEQYRDLYEEVKKS